LKKFYGPFVEDKNGVWHWNKSCSRFPEDKNARTMISTGYPDSIKLCDECHKADESEFRTNSFDKSRI